MMHEIDLAIEVEFGVLTFLLKLRITSEDGGTHLEHKVKVEDPVLA